nr:hypothetical protein [Paenibacillus xylanexedens]
MEYNKLEVFLNNLSILSDYEEEQLSKYYFVPNSNPNLFFNSFIVRCFSFIERYLFDLSDFLLDNRDIKLKTERDFTGSSFEKLKKCLSSIMHIVIDENLWKEIDFIRIIRNTIIHKESEINEGEQKRLEDYINQHYIMNGWSDFLITNKNYCKYVLSVISDFIIHLYNVIEDRNWRKKYLWA